MPRLVGAPFQYRKMTRPGFQAHLGQQARFPNSYIAAHHQSSRANGLLLRDRIQQGANNAHLRFPPHERQWSDE